MCLDIHRPGAVVRLRLMMSFRSAAAAPIGDDWPPITVTRPMVSVS